MRAAVTVGPRWRSTSSSGRSRATTAEGSTLLRMETVGICGSDLHFFTNELGPTHEKLFPRVQGHEFSAVVEAVDPAGSPFEIGDRVAVWPVSGCGRCRSCTAGRPNVCSEIDLIGVHHDGALQDLVLVDTANVVAADDLSPAQTALVEPVSIAIHTVVRAGVRAGEQIVVFGAGPIGFATAIAARGPRRPGHARRPVASRRELVVRAGFDAGAPDAGVARWAGRGGRSAHRHRHDRPAGRAADRPRPGQQRRACRRRRSHRRRPRPSVRGRCPSRSSTCSVSAAAWPTSSPPPSSSCAAIEGSSTPS